MCTCIAWYRRVRLMQTMADGRWRRARSRYLLPVKVRQQMFRGRYVAELRRQCEHTGLSSAQLTRCWMC